MDKRNKWYQQGYIDGLSAFAWWKDGKQYVGSPNLTLKEAIEKAEKCVLWNYNPPK